MFSENYSYYQKNSILYLGMVYWYIKNAMVIKNGLVRINMELLPHAHSIFSPWLVIVSTIQIIYAASTSSGQRNLKKKEKRIAYSSISHMGFIVRPQKILIF